MNAQDAKRRPEPIDEDLVAVFTDDAVVLESVGGWDGESTLCVRPEDARLVVEARNALPLLLAVVEAARAQAEDSQGETLVVLVEALARLGIEALPR